MKAHHYYLYIITNKRRNVLYIGITNNLLKRIDDHYDGKIPGFSQLYKCKYLIYYEHYEDVNFVIYREKTLKKWRRDKKEKLIQTLNPEWRFLNDQILAIERCFES